MRLIFVDRLPASGSGLYFAFQPAVEAGSGWRNGDADALIRVREAKWLEQLEQWHIELSRRAAGISKLWWFLPASRILSWYPPVADKFFFALAVVERSEVEKADCAYVVGAPRETADFFRELRPNWIIEILDSTTPLSATASPQRHGRWRLLLDWLWKTTRNTFRTWPNGSPPDVVVYSHAMSGQNLRASGDHFFGRGLRELMNGSGRRARVLWLYLYVPNDGATKEEIREIVRESAPDSHRAVFIDDAIGWPEALQILRLNRRLRQAAQQIRFMAPPLTIDGLASRAFLDQWLDPQSVRHSALSEAMISVAAQRLFRAVSPEVLLYPYEEKGLERALLEAARSAQRPVRTFGFAHAVHSKGHMYMRDRRVHGIDHPLPDFIGATGPSARDWLHTWGGHPLNRLAVLGSPRYIEALEPIAMIEKPRLLALISSSHELPALATLVHAHPRTFDGWQLVIRRYPYAWHDIQDEAVARLKASGVDLIEEGGPLRAQLNGVHAAIFCSSSAGFEAMLSARITIYVNLNIVLELDPITGKGASDAVFMAHRPQDLKDILSHIRSLTSEEARRHAERQRAFAVGVYAPPSFQQVLSHPEIRVNSSPANFRSAKEADASTLD